MIANAGHGKGSYTPLRLGFKSIAARAGLSVSEFTVEITVDEAIVSANCRKNCPVIPVMNAHGMNTAERTRPTAITGDETSLIALSVAARGFSPCSMWCSTASTTTIASSTTIPIASTSPKSVRLFRLKPITSITANVPTMPTGTATSGMIDDRQFWRKISTTRATSITESSSVLNTSWIDSRMNGVVS